MNALLTYLLKVMAIQAVLYLIYALVFHKSGRHAFNRYLVILALIVSFIIPLISITIPDTITSTASSEIAATDIPIWYELAELTTAKPELIPVKNNSQLDLTALSIFAAIVCISLLLLMRLFHSHIQLLKLKRQSEKVLKHGYSIYSSNIESAFSYFSAIFIPKSILTSSSFDTILKHELVHVKKGHSVDRIFLELILAVFWFNPFHYLFRNRLIEIHEFQADEEVISIQKDPIAYQEVLYQQVNGTYAVATANHFKLNTIKTRINMMNQHKKLSKWYYLFLLPAVALMTFSFAHKKNREFIAPLKSDVFELFDFNLNPSDRYTPSIFPLKEADGVKLTSGFGKRMHPILKAERMHEGIDLKTFEGNPVLATADGMVIEVEALFGGYGKRIIIDHNGLYQTAYAHLSEFKVAKGDMVKKGDIIGAAGITGMAVDFHLHYQVKEIEIGYLDPVDFIKNYDFKTNKTKTTKTGAFFIKPNQKLKVVIDPGHGGYDKGLASNQLAEKDVVLKVAKAIAQNFNNSDKVEIILTRETDAMVSLADRVNHSENADLFISLHVETEEHEEEDSMLAIYHDDNENTAGSKHFTELLHQEFSNIDKKFKVGYSRIYYVLKNAKCPAVLFNMGYISNPDAEQYLNSEDGIMEIAQELTDAIKATL